MFFKPPSWLPTKSDQIQFRRQDIERYERELPEIGMKMMRASDDAAELENRLCKSFNSDQMEIWLKLKVKSQEAVFQKGRWDHHSRRLHEIPVEIDQLME